MQVFKKMTQTFYNLDIFVREHVKQTKNFNFSSNMS